MADAVDAFITAPYYCFFSSPFAPTKAAMVPTLHTLRNDGNQPNGVGGAAHGDLYSASHVELGMSVHCRCAVQREPAHVIPHQAFKDALDVVVRSLLERAVSSAHGTFKKIITSFLVHRRSVAFYSRSFHSQFPGCGDYVGVCKELSMMVPRGAMSTKVWG